MTSKFKLIHHVDQMTIDEMYNHYSPVFILSTGRSGSKLIVELLNQSENIEAFHEPRPTLQYFSNYAYHNQKKEQILKKIIDGVRMEMILEVFINDKIYMESNQCLTFFAPVLARLFKRSKFVHLIRHPGNFVSSAVRKGWHKNDSIWESGRVRPADHNQWKKMDHIQRLSWVWAATNGYIKKFGEKINPSRFHTVQFENLVDGYNAVKKLISFVNADEIDVQTITTTQNKKFSELTIHPYEPPNIKKQVHYPEYKDWTESRKAHMRPFVLDLAHHYGYEL